MVGVSLAICLLASFLFKPIPIPTLHLLNWDGWIKVSLFFAHEFLYALLVTGRADVRKNEREGY
jgi:hypothetical protein